MSDPITIAIDQLATTALGIKNERDFLRGKCDQLIAEVAKLRRLNDAMVSVLNDAREHIDQCLNALDDDQRRRDREKAGRA